MRDKVSCKVYLMDDTDFDAVYLCTVDIEPECGTDFCERCGDCISCYAYTGCWYDDELHDEPHLFVRCYTIEELLGADMRNEIICAAINEHEIKISPLVTQREFLEGFFYAKGIEWTESTDKQTPS